MHKCTPWKSFDVWLHHSVCMYIYTMMKPYIKGIPRCIFKHIHPHSDWYVSYTPHTYYAHLKNIFIQLIMSPLVGIVIDE